MGAINPAEKSGSGVGGIVPLKMYGGIDVKGEVITQDGKTLVKLSVPVKGGGRADIFVEKDLLLKGDFIGVTVTRDSKGIHAKFQIKGQREINLDTKPGRTIVLDTGEDWLVHAAAEGPPNEYTTTQLKRIENDTRVAVKTYNADKSQAAQPTDKK